MSESVKPRFAVDLNDIERQLAQAGAQPAPASRNDPLAELARIVGQDDPFQSILADDGSVRPRQQASAIDDLFAARDTMASPPRAAQTRRPHGGHEVPGFDLDQYSQRDRRAVQPGYAHQPVSSSAHGEEAYESEHYSQGYHDDAGRHYAAAGYGAPERLDYPPVEKSRPRKGMVAIGVVVGAVVIGGAGAYMFGGSSSVTDGAPPLIKAATEPVKVQPKNPGGVEIPNQNKQIYERANQTETKVVNREEQPVDVEQAVRMSGGAVADAAGGTVSTAPAQPRQPAIGLNLGEPRKVRTVTIRPDGTVVQPDGGGARPGPAPVPAMTLPAEARPAPSSSSAPNSVQPAPARPKPVASTPAAVAETPAPAPVAPAPSGGTSSQKVASAQPLPITPPAVEPEPMPTGDYSVQLGLAKTEGAAETAFEQFQRKYSDLEGLPSLIVKTELNGNTVYRVRVGPMSREEASSLCSKLQGQGGQCFVAKNN